MATRLEVMQELDRRGKLPANIKPVYDEAVKRGLIGGAANTNAPSATATTPTPAVTAQQMAEKEGLPIPGTTSAIQEPEAPSGVFNNVTAGVNNALYTVAGAPVDLSRGAINSMIEGPNAITANVPGLGGVLQATSTAAKALGVQPIPEDSIGGHKSIAAGLENVGVNNPDKVVAKDANEKVARGIGEGIGMAITPTAILGGLAKIGVVGPEALAMLEQITGSTSSAKSIATNAIVSGTAGGGGALAQEVAPESMKPAAGVIGNFLGAGAGAVATSLPGLFRAGSRVVADAAAPLSLAGREKLAGKTLANNATAKPATLIQKLSEQANIVPGSKPTTFQQTGDLGLGALERGVSTKNPDVFAQRRAEQNTARVDSLSNLAPDAAPETVATAVRQHLDDIQAQADAAVTKATAEADASTSAANAVAEKSLGAANTKAQGSLNALGAGTVPEVAGAATRDAYEAARSAEKQQERAVWKAVDPDGKLALAADNTKSGADDIVTSLPASAKPPEGEEAAILGVAQSYGDVVPLNELTALQSRLKTAMRNEKMLNGETPAWARMSQLNGSIQSDLETAVTAKVAQDQAEVAAGTMSDADTLLSKLQREADAFVEQRNAASGQNGGASLGRNGGGRPSSFSSLGGAKVFGAGGPANGAGSEGLSPNALGANFDGEALGRLNTARATTKQRVETFDNKTMAPIRKRPSTVSPYDMPSGAVPGRFFFAGPKSPEAIDTLANAIGRDNAVTVLRDYAVDRLRKAAVDAAGALDPGKATTWLRNHADALRALPELRQSVQGAIDAAEAVTTEQATQKTAIKSVDDAAKGKVAEAARAAKKQVDDAQIGAVGKLMGLTEPADIVRTIGGIFSRQDAVAQITKLRDAIGSSPEALKGLKKAVAQFMTDKLVGNAEAGTSGVGTMKSDQFQTFVKSNADALKAAGFTDAEVQTMADIGADLQRSNRSVSSVKNPGGSNTAQDTLAAKSADSTGTLFAKIMMNAAAPALTGITANQAGGLWLGIPVALGTALLSAMRQSGLAKVDDLVKEAMLNPDLARALLTKVKPEVDSKPVITLTQILSRAAAQ